MLASNTSLTDQLRAALRAPSGAGGDVALTAATHNARSEDIAEAMRDLANSEALAVFNWLDNERAADVLGALEPDTARYLISNAPPARIADLLDRLPMDDAAWVVSEAPPELAEILMAQLQARAPEDAEEVRELLTYEENTAGRLMNDNFVRLSPEMTVAQAFSEVRRSDSEVETVSDLYVVEGDARMRGRERLVGVLSLRELVRAKDEQIIGDIMTPDLITVSVDTDQEEAARIVRKYDFLAMPVLDREGFLAGIITVDDIIDVLAQEQAEDQLRFAGVELNDSSQPYFSTPLLQVVKSRIGWLVLLFAASQLSGEVLASNDLELQKVAALTVFIPLLIGTGGNTGAQTVSTIIRGLSLGEVRFKDIYRVLGRELLGGLMLGSLLAVIGFAVVAMRSSDRELAIVVSLSVLAICTWANTISALIPLLAQRFKIDPALVSAPLITTLVDATGLAIYLGIAKMLLSALN